MVDGLKTYNEFKKVIDQLGNVKLAWFTTFNFSVDFFERFILSALIKSSPYDLKSLKDFEVLNDRIVNTEDGAIDVKVFHDYRAMSPEIKRTSVQTIGIKPGDINASFAHGVFHPKVALLVNDKNEAFVSVGSANLTISGWSKNSEGVISKAINDRKNAQAITDFFLALIPNDSSDAKRITDLNNTWQKSLNVHSDWEFVSSISKKSMLDSIREESCEELTVWSPYFSEDLSEVVQEYFSWVRKMRIVPDVTSNGSIRLTNDAISKALDSPHVGFLEDPHFKNEDLLVHAKVWSTPTKIAVGSWNFTKAGLNLSSTNSNNIEAGIVQDITPKVYQNFIGSCNLREMEAPVGMLKEELEDEKKELLSNWKINCQIYADWSNYKYKLVSADDFESKVFYFDLPGMPNRIASNTLLHFDVSFYDGHKSLLKDRLFSVYDKAEGGERVFIGVIVEMNPVQRPAVGFESIQDLLRAWSDRKPEKKTQFQQINYTNDTETGEELSEQISKALKGDYSNAWFTMFLAFEQIKVRLREAHSDANELNRIGYRIPGSITQVSEHLNFLKENLSSNDSEMSSAFIWFMINEGNQIIDLFNSLIKNESPIISRVVNVELNFNEVEKTKMNTWLNYIKERCSYT